MNLPDRTRPASPEAIEDVAAAWLARRYGGFTPDEAAQFESWLAEDPRHQATFAELEEGWRLVSSVGASGQGGIARQRERVRQRFRARRRRRIAFAAAGMTAVFLFLSLLVPALRIYEEPGIVPGIVLRPDLRNLPDGSTVQLNAGAEIAWDFTTERRLVRLIGGEALFTVAKDPARPFVVSVGGVEVQAVGTAFAVHYNVEQVHVLVTEGTVAVNPATTPAQTGAVGTLSPPPLRLTASQRTVLSLAPDPGPPSVANVTPAEIDAALAWRNRRIEFTRTPLASAVELFNRNSTQRLKVADAATANFEISGIFWENDPEAFVRLLVSAFDVEADRSGESVVLRKR